MTTELEDFFEHHGIKGMRWGVRRDRSRVSTSSKTPEKTGTGKASTSAKPATKTVSTSKASSTPAKPSTPDAPSKPGVKELSDAELRAAIDRLNMEKQYSQLTATPAATRKQNEGKRVVKEILLNVAKQSAQEILKTAATAAGKQALSMALKKQGNDELAAMIFSTNKKKDKN